MRWLAAFLLPLFVLGLTACGDDDGGSTSTAAAPTAEDLDGRTFVSTSSTGHDLVTDSTVSLSFADGQLSAHAGCNTQNGGFEVTDGALVLTSEMASTMMGCEEPLMDQDQWLAAFLAADPAIALDGELLTLTGDGESLELAEEV